MDERGKDGYPRAGEYAIDRTYAQDHEPVVEQEQAVGHCVRAISFTFRSPIWQR